MKLPFKRSKLSICIGLVLSTNYQANAAEELAHNEDMLEEIVITSAFRTSEADTAMPVGILAGEALREQAANSLGETLRNEIGINVANYGPGVGQPLIRGQGGSRVKVLQNNIGVIDVAAL